jgi:hypothetical protein
MKRIRSSMAEKEDEEAVRICEYDFYSFDLVVVHSSSLLVKYLSHYL